MLIVNLTTVKLFINAIKPILSSVENFDCEFNHS